MAKLEDVHRGLRAEDLPDELQEPLRPLLATIDAALTAVFSAIAGGNLTLTDNVAVEKIECQLSHGVTQVVLLKKIKRAGCIVGYSAGEDASGVGHAFLVPPVVQPASTPGMAQITAYFRNNTAKRVACTFYVAPEGTNSSKAKSTAPYVSLTSDVTGVLPEANGGTNQSTYAKGDTLYASAVNTLSKLSAGTNGYVYTMQAAGIPGWSPAAGGGTGGLSQVDYMQVRRWGATYASSTTANTFTSFGMAVPTLAGAATTSPFASRNMVALTPAAAVAGTVGGLTGPYTETRPGYSNKFSITVLTDAAGTLNMLHSRQWFGLASTTGVGAIAPGSGASVIHFAVIGYDTDVSPNWKFMTGDGTNYSTTDLGVVVAAATYHLIVLDWTTKATPTATIYDAAFDTNTFSLLVGPTGKSTNVTTSTTANLGVNATVTLGENASKAVYFSKLMLEQN